MLITIGSFDGFHKGHAKLLDICRENSAPGQWGVVTFYPHPSEYMNRLKHSMFTLRERELVRRVLGIPNMFVLEFNETLKNLEPPEFWRLVRERFGVDGLVMGSDFHFGRNRSGSAEYLAELARSEGISRIFIAELKEKCIYSSSMVREKVIAGDVEGASDILGYNWFMMGKIIHGKHRGRTMHYPTANIDISGRSIFPAYGVYSSAVLVNGEWHCGAVSIGNNPTFHDVNDTRAEVYILDFDGSIYGDELPVFFLGRVREVIKFEDKEGLMRQIGQDIISCRKIYGEVMSCSDTEKFLERAGEIYKSQKINPEIIKLI